MRSKRTRPVQTKTKTHIMTGGVKEDVSQLELKGGELLVGENVQEIDGAYHGYSSIPGYENFWGDELPSTVPVELISDPGKSNDVILLLSTYNGIIEDLSNNHFPVNAESASIDLYLSRFPSGAIFTHTKYPSVFIPASSSFDFGADNWEVDFVVSGVTTGHISSFGLGNKISIVNGHVVWQYGLNGGLNTGTLTSLRTVNPALSTHVAIQRSGTKVRIAIDGKIDGATANLLLTDAVTYIEEGWDDEELWNDEAAWEDTPNFLFFGFMGYVEEFRVCRGTIKWVEDFSPPTQQYADPYFVTRVQYDDTAREAARALIEPVGGIDGTGPVRAVAYFKGEAFAVRDVLGLATVVYAKSLHPASCTNIGPTGYNEFGLGGTYQFTRGSFFAFGDGLNNFQEYIRKEVLFLVTGISSPVWFDGLDYRHIDHAGLPDNAADADAREYAVSARVFKDRLFLGYPSGQVVFSAPGDPLNFSYIDGAGSFNLPAGCTDLISAPGDALVMFTLGSINIAKTLADAGISTNESTYMYKFFNEDFSQSSGCIKSTAQRIMGMVLFMDDRGVSSLEATDAFGDFNAGTLSRNVQKTLLTKKPLITCSTVLRANNQYRLFFNDKTGIIFTFDSEKKVKGATTLKYKHPVLCIDTQKDLAGAEITLFGSADGCVYKMDSGTSFNGEPIVTKINTTFYHYSTPSYRKRFRKVSLEASAPRGLIFFGKLEFDYRSIFTVRGITEELASSGSGGIYGQDLYGQFTYGATAVETPTLYDDGYGENMSVFITTSDKFREPHTINSMLVEYVVVNRVHS